MESEYRIENVHNDVQNVPNIRIPDKNNLSTSSLIWPSYTIRATTFEKVFWFGNSPKLSKFLFWLQHFIAPSLNLMLCLSVCLVFIAFIALIASLLRREGKQAIKKQDRHSNRALMARREKNMLQRKISPPSSKIHRVTFHFTKTNSEKTQFRDS